MPDTFQSLLSLLLLLSGFGQLALFLVSPIIPFVLKWREDTRRLRPLTRQVFWTYSAYIWITNLWFALLCLFLRDSLLGQTPLAAAVTSFMALYWAGRIGIQFFYFDRSQAPPGIFPKLGEVALVLLFLYLATTLGIATLYNLRVL